LLQIWDLRRQQKMITTARFCFILRAFILDKFYLCELTNFLAVMQGQYSSAHGFQGNTQDMDVNGPYSIFLYHNKWYMYQRLSSSWIRMSDGRPRCRAGVEKWIF
jgi:hypothetical protein